MGKVMANGDHASGNGVRWLAGILIGLVLSALSSLGAIALRHEGAIAANTERQQGEQQQMDRMERKLDRALDWIIKGKP